ncbi:MAG: hypothetical protein M1836_003742 [Candelina mexicana]|nr:MAG: hypothetical protein M1836_003742 [Candelina mexicana]
MQLLTTNIIISIFTILLSFTTLPVLSLPTPTSSSSLDTLAKRQISMEGNLQDLGRLVDGLGNGVGGATDSLAEKRQEAPADAVIDVIDDVVSGVVGEEPSVPALPEQPSQPAQPEQPSQPAENRI